MEPIGILPNCGYPHYYLIVQTLSNIRLYKIHESNSLLCPLNARSPRTADVTLIRALNLSSLIQPWLWRENLKSMKMVLLYVIYHNKRAELIFYCAPKQVKQLKLIPFPNMEPDNDVAMSDIEPILPAVHSRLYSNASSFSSNGSDSPSSDSRMYWTIPPHMGALLTIILAVCPVFSVCPSPFFSTDTVVLDHPDFTLSSNNNQIGLLQPKSTFVHHGYAIDYTHFWMLPLILRSTSHSSTCTQIPKLRIACASGIGGQRSMWTHCEECGAISIVESD